MKKHTLNPMYSMSHEELKKVFLSLGTPELAELFSLPRDIISYWRKKLKAPSPFGLGQRTRKFFLNERFFENVDNEEKAYILGFIAADGNINPGKYGCEIRIVLHPKDVDILEKINKAWESTYIIKDHKLGQFSGYSGSSKLQKKLSIASSLMQKDLAKYRIVPCKTLILRYPNIPKILDRHFLRGFLDGDGYINHEAFGWTTNPLMANDVQRICIEHGFAELKRYSVKEHSHTVRGTPIHSEILSWIYGNSNISLNRKKEQYVLHWENRVYKRCRKTYTSTKHIPCALEALPPVLGSMP